MRTLLISSLVIAYVAATFLSVAPPPAIKVHAPTPEEITNQVHQEEYNRKVEFAERIARRIYESHGCFDEDLVSLTAQKAVDHSISSGVLAALIFVESGCHEGAIAKVDGKITACGLTQVNPQVWNISCEDLLDPDTAVETGTTILASYKSRYGLRGGLHHYLGMGTDDGQLDGDTYATRVLLVAGYRHPELVR